MMEKDFNNKTCNNIQLRYKHRLSFENASARCAIYATPAFGIKNRMILDNGIKQEILGLMIRPSI